MTTEGLLADGLAQKSLYDQTPTKTQLAVLVGSRLSTHRSKWTSLPPRYVGLLGPDLVQLDTLKVLGISRRLRTILDT